MNPPNKEQNYLVSLAIVYYVFAGIFALVALAIGFNVVGLLLALTKLATGGRLSDFYVAGLLTGIAGFVTTFIGAIMHLAMGNCLRRRRNYGYCWFMGVIQLINFPFGTLLGVFTLIVLRNKVIRDTYGTWMPPRKIPQRSPQAFGPQASGHVGYSSMPSPDSLKPGTTGYQPVTGYGGGRSGMSMGQLLMIFGLIVGLLLAALSTVVVVIAANKLRQVADDVRPVEAPITSDGTVAAPFTSDGIAETPEQNEFDPDLIAEIPSADGSPGVINSINDFLALLRSTDPNQQRIAAKFFRGAGVQADRSEEVARALTRVVNAGGPSAGIACEALLEWGGKADAMTIAGAIERGVVDKLPAIRFLRRAGNPSTMETIARLLRDGDPNVAAAAESALLSFGPEARPALAKIADGGDAALATQAQRLLTQMDAASDTTGIASRIQQLQSTNPSEARSAALWFSTAEVDASRQAAVARALETAIANPDATVRQAAYEAATRWADQASGAFFLDKLQNDPNATVAAINVLAALQYAPAAPALVDLLKQPGPNQSKAAEALTALGKDATQGAVLPLFNHPEESVRRGARNILQGFRTPLEILVEHSIADIKAAGAADTAVSDVQGGKAAMAIIWLRQLELTADQKTAIADAAAPVAGGDHTGAAVQALQYLIQARDRRVAAPFARFIGNINNLQQARTFMRSTGKNGELLARGQLTSDNAQVVSAVAVILADIGVKDSVPALERAKNKWQKAGKQQLVNALETAIRQAGSR